VAGKALKACCRGRTLAALALLGALLTPQGDAAAEEAGRRQVFVVMSYHESVPIEREIKAALDEALAGVELDYFWLDTQRHPEEGERRAHEAFERYRALGPDVVVAANDSAQALFVVPYLRDRVATPVVFCGVNNDAGKYGYPAGNVSGVLEIKHYRESIAFAQLIDPRIRRVGVVYHDNPSNRSNLDQLRRERETYAAEVTAFVRVSTLDELDRAVRDLESRDDALLVLDLSGVVDGDGGFVEERQLQRRLARMSRKPTIAATASEVEAGILCGVTKQDREQGTLAAAMVAELLAGRPLRDLPVTQNTNGLRLLNISTLQRLGMRAPPEAVAGTRIVTLGE